MEFFAQNIIPGEVLVQLLAFGIVFFALKALAWKPFLTTLEARRERIRTELEEIENAKCEIDCLRADYDSRLRKIQEEAREKLQESVEEGRRISRELADEARHEAQNILEKVKSDIRLEHEKATATLREEIATLALAATERLVQAKLDQRKDRELALNFIQELESIR